MTAPPVATTRTRWRDGWMPAVVVLLAVVGLAVVVWRPTAPELSSVPTDLDMLPVEVAAAIDAYRSPRLWPAVATWVLAALAPWLVVRSRWGRRGLGSLEAADTADGRGWTRMARGALVGAVLAVAAVLVRLPLVVWARLVQDGDWQVRTASAALWWRDWVVSAAITAVFAGAAVGGIALLVRWRPRTWPWHLAWAGTIAVAVTTLVWPVVISPLFAPSRPLEDPTVRAIVEDVADRAGLGDLPIRVEASSTRSTHVNAVVVGLGPSRRVVLHDTLLERPLDEIGAVVAHEFAHQQHRDVERAVLATLPALLAVGLVVRGVLGKTAGRRVLGVPDDHDPGGLRMLAGGVALASALTLVVEPVALWQSRRVEAAADAAAIDLGADPATVVALDRRLAIDNLSPMDRPTWVQVLFGSHPTPGQRVRAAVAEAAADGVDLPDRADYERREAADPPRWDRPDG